QPFAFYRVTQWRESGLATALNDMHPATGLDPLVEVHHVVIEHAHAAARHRFADRPRLVRAVNAEQRVVAVLVEIDRAGAERIVDTAGHAAGIFQVLARIAADHVRRWRPG